MKYLSILACCLALLTSAAAQSGRTLLRGYVISNQDADLVQLASITNKSTGQHVVSNRQGLFRVPVTGDDTLLFSAIGYEPLSIIVRNVLPANPEDTIRVMMISRSYRLKDVNIISSNHKRDSIARLAAEFLKNDPLMNNYDRVLKRPRGSGLNGVITEMYYQFSKAGQDMVHFEEFLAYTQAQREIDKKYNRDLVKRVSNIPDAYLDDLMIHCRPNRDFAVRTQEYDMLMYIKTCSDEYKTRHGITD